MRSDAVRVGDIIKVKDDEIVPADCLLLTSGYCENNPSSFGQCFISTGSLDGERNLKPKMAIKEVEDSFTDIITGSREKIIVEVNVRDAPMPNLYHFDAYMKLVYQEHQSNMIDLDLKQFIPRGSHVRNSGCLYLLVLYTGPQTKLILNQGSYRFK